MLDSELVVTRLGIEDYDEVRALWELAGLPVRPVGRDSREQFAQQLTTGVQTVIGVRVNQRLIGVVLTTHDGRKGWINRLAVHPDYRRQGLGQRLIVEAEHMLHDQGMQIIAALIEDENEASLALFAQAGYADYPSLHYVSKRNSRDV